MERDGDLRRAGDRDCDFRRGEPETRLRELERERFLRLGERFRGEGDCFRGLADVIEKCGLARSRLGDRLKLRDGLYRRLGAGDLESE